MNISITKKRIILVEGKDDKGIIESICKEEQLDDAIQVIPYVEEGKLTQVLRLLVRDANFEQVHHIGLTKDSDRGAERARQSLESAWNHARKELKALDIPEPKCSVFAVPDNRSTGRVEDLCLQSAAFPRVLRCARLMYWCARMVSIYRMDRQKSLVAAYLSLMQKSRVPLGASAVKGYWNLRSDAFGPLREFVISIGTQ